MAKPIEPTPKICGEDVIRFYKIMQKEETNPDPKRLKIIEKGIEVFSKISKK